MTTVSARARVRRRLQFRSRSAAVSVVLLFVVAACAYLSTEALRALLGAPPFFANPFVLLQEADRYPGPVIAALVAAAVVCLALAAVPGRLRRRVVDVPGPVIVVDDDVIASSLSRTVATRVDLPPGQVRTSVSRRRVHIRVTPSSGFPVSRDAARDCAATLIADAALRPAPRPSVSVEPTGVLR